MRPTLPIRQKRLEALKKVISKSIAEATPYIQAAKENQVKILSQKFSQLNNWYINVTGLDKVHLAQEKVTGLRDQLLEIQEKRRDVGRQLSEIRSRSMELQDEIHKIKRQDDLERYLDLMKKETEVLKLEKSISKTFQDYDETERELFTAFSDSIRDSHEKQRAQMEYTKYFGLVLSITGSFLAFVYSTLRKEQLKKVIDERLKTLENFDGRILVSEIAQINNKVMVEVMANRKALNELRKAVNSCIANLKGQESKAVLVDVDSDKNIGSSFGDTHYLQMFGVVLGIWLLARSLSG